MEGVIHIHTSLSRDGEMDPAELKEFCRDAGLSFACVTDHYEDLSDSDMKHLVDSCENLTDDEFTMLPGLELALDEHTHMLAVGLRMKPDDLASPTLLQDIKAGGALLVLAHPLEFLSKPDVELLASMDGLEVWNCGHDGGFFPNPAVLAQFSRVSRMMPHLIAYGGDDLHRREEKVQVRTVLYEPARHDRLLAALKEGAFKIRGRLWEMGSSPSSRMHTLAALGASYGAYRSARKVRDLIQHSLRPEAMP